ncbi:MAG TPA: hypothetical protein VFV36_05910 [Candidatus Methylomirabilis sp.]|nr:hypothetical protein [Candidatus Methylomirabilis sp.]
MPFAYYRRLSPAEQRVYRRSDAVTAVPLPPSHGLRPQVGELAEALRSGDSVRTGAAADRLLRSLCAALGVSPVRAEVLAARPARHWGELHGLYAPAERGRPARVTLWMRTAQRRQVVALRTFLRTLLHELCHHLDYELLRLPDSLHTEGFYKRESSLFRRLMGEARPPARPGGEGRGALIGASGDGGVDLLGQGGGDG